MPNVSQALQVVLGGGAEVSPAFTVFPAASASEGATTTVKFNLGRTNAVNSVDIVIDEVYDDAGAVTTDVAFDTPNISVAANTGFFSTDITAAAATAGDYTVKATFTANGISQTVLFAIGVTV